MKIETIALLLPLAQMRFPSEAVKLFYE